MNRKLKRAIIEWIFNNENEFQLVNTCHENFRQFIYTEKGDYCFGGGEVSDFIKDAIKLLKA